MSKKSISKIVENFIEFEKDNSLCSVRINGYNLWEYIRYEVWNEITHSFLVFDNSKTAYNKPRKFYDYPLKLKKNILCRLRNIFIKGKYQIIILNPSINRIIDGKNVDMYIYHILKKIVKDYKVLLVNQGFEIINNDYQCNVFFCPYLSLRIKLLSLLTRFSKKDTIKLKYIENKILEKFDTPLDIITISKNVIAYKIKERKHRFNKIFKRYNPKLFLYVDDGSMQGILATAHNQGITTIELQHSVVSKINPQYQWYPKSYNYNTIPKKIFSFGNYWKDSFNLNSTIVPVGFPYYEFSKKIINNDLDRINSNNLIVNSSIISKNDLMLTTIQLSKLLNNCKIYYKLRPNEYDTWRKNYSSEFQSKDNIIVIDNEDTHLYQYYKRCGYQIGVNSTTIYEGIGHGLITFILKSGWYEEMDTLYNNGLAYLVNNADEIAKIIKNKNFPLDKPNINDIFVPNSVDNIINGISKEFKAN
jgi:hypothetical protein